jgi:hypothetical protein
MNIFIPRHQELIEKLLEYNVDFILIGGYAVIYYGYGRTTGDMDLWLKPSEENKQKMIQVLKHFEFDRDGIDHISALDFTTHVAFHFWEEPERVDCLTKISGVQFEEANAKKIIADFEGLKIPIIQYEHLIASKMMTGRLKDKADIEELQKVNRKKE